MPTNNAFRDRTIFHELVEQAGGGSRLGAAVTVVVVTDTDTGTVVVVVVVVLVTKVVVVVAVVVVVVVVVVGSGGQSEPMRNEPDEQKQAKKGLGVIDWKTEDCSEHRADGGPQIDVRSQIPTRINGEQRGERRETNGMED